ncbi:hypothetical protein [Kitasatospora sp. NPDC004289]
MTRGPLVTCQIAAALVLVAAGAGTARAETTEYPVTYNAAFDDPDGSLDGVTCGEALEAKGYRSFKDIPGFPHIGGAPSSVIEGYGSPNCGSTWTLTYPPPSTAGSSTPVTVTVVVVDSSGEVFNTSFAAFDVLTSGQGAQLGRVQASAERVPDPGTSDTAH